ncbi:hypothetical protein UlMin_020094 [Ulmus minor]
MMSKMPNEIISNILSRLPAKDVFGCRCVSKSWCYLIDSPYFVKIHLNHSNETNSNRGLLLQDKQNELHWLDLNNLKSVVKLNLPIKFKDCEYQVLGSCNGLLALSASDYLFALWNPFTRRSINLPLPKTHSEGNIDNYNYGFGYDPIGDDYKLVRIFGLRKKISSGWLDIYSLKSNNWRRVGDFPYCFFDCSDGVLFNNALHWVVYPKEASIASQFILAFDVASEEYRKVPIPHTDYGNGRPFCVVGTLGGCLCVNYILHWKCTDVWVMKEYGVKESWTKLFSVSNCCSDFLRSFTYWKTSDKVLMNHINEEYILYDLKTKRYQSVEVPLMPEDFDPKTCVQSLVGLNNGDWKTVQEE